MIFLDNYVSFKITQTVNSFIYIFEIDLKRVNLSTFDLVSNLKSFLLSKNYILGNGIGSIETTYYRYFSNKNYYSYELNSNDGYSLGIRILSEMGLVGIIILLWFIFTNVNFKIKNKLYSKINISFLVGIISYILRGGSYYLQGTIMFFLFLTCSKKKQK